MKLRDQEDEEEVLPSYSNHPLTSDTENSSSGSASHKDVNKASTADPTFENDCPFTLDNIRHWMYLTLGLIIGLLLIINLSNARNSSTSTTTTTSTATGMRAFDISNAIILNKDDINVQSTAFMSYYSYPSQSSSNVVYARLSKWVVDKQAPLLYVEQITKGVGIVDLFWDPADIIGQDEMKFRLDPSGTRVLLFARQNRFRGDASLMQESFAESVLGSFAIINVDESSYWIDFSSFTQSNVGLLHGKDLASAISSVYGSQYCYAFDSELSFLDTNVVKANSYRSTFQSLITYSMCNKQGASLPVKYFEQSLASSTHLSITVRRTFIKLRPLSVDAHAITNNDDDGYSKSDLTTYVPRWFHPKSGFNSIAFRNEDKSLWSSRLTQYITRFNLSPTAPSNQKIQFYVDRNIPEPYLTAIIEGIMWWDAAFQFAGYKAGTFSAKVAAADLDPFDFYTDGSSFVHWIDRDVRFYSIGLRVIDPRTGEVLKGHVRLEGLRIRQDALLAQALLSKDSYSSELQRKGDILSCIMQRVRHLGAHEVGHALGLAHNFAGSTSSSGYSSVMDYPPPLVQMKDGQLRLNEDSYSNGIGIFDKVSIKYGYGPFASDRMEVEQQLLIDYLSSAEQQYGYVFLTDENSADSAADWRDTRWDQGTNPIEALQSSMEVRKKALQSLNLNSFVETSIPLARLMELFPMIYLWHRYEVEAVTKLIGGRVVSYDVKSASSIGNSANFVAASVQQKAVQQLVKALSPAEITIPSSVLDLPLSLSFGYSVDVGSAGDLFSSRFGEGLLDPVTIYETYAQLILDNILLPPRLERLAYQKTVNGSLPGIEDVVTALYNGLFDPIVAQKAICGNNLLEVSTMQSSFISKVILRIQGYEKSSMSSLAQRGVYAAKYFIQTQLMSISHQSADSFCPTESACIDCYDNAKLYLDSIQFLLNKVLSSAEYLADLPVPIGPPL